jgi:urea transporter
MRDQILAGAWIAALVVGAGWLITRRWAWLMALGTASAGLALTTLACAAHFMIVEGLVALFGAAFSAGLFVVVYRWPEYMK